MNSVKSTLLHKICSWCRIAVERVIRRAEEGTVQTFAASYEDIRCFFDLKADADVHAGLMEVGVSVYVVFARGCTEGPPAAVVSCVVRPDFQLRMGCKICY